MAPKSAPISEQLIVEKAGESAKASAGQTIKAHTALPLRVCFQSDCLAIS